MSEKASKGRFFKPEISSKISVKKTKEKGEKERARRRKGGQEKKAVVALLVFIIATLEIIFGRKKIVGRKRSIWL